MSNQQKPNEGSTETSSSSEESSNELAHSSVESGTINIDHSISYESEDTELVSTLIEEAKQSFERGDFMSARASIKQIKSTGLGGLNDSDLEAFHTLDIALSTDKLSEFWWPLLLLSLWALIAYRTVYG